MYRQEDAREKVAPDAEGVGKIRDRAKYAKIVEWSQEDQCYVGSAPGLLLGGCHGDDEKQVFDELCQIVKEAINLYRKDNKFLPPATAGQGAPIACRISHNNPDPVDVSKGPGSGAGVAFETLNGYGVGGVRCLGTGRSLERLPPVPE